MRITAFASALSALLLISCTTPPAEVETKRKPATVFLVRHAEKVDWSKDPDLSEAGKQRAEVLAAMLNDAGIERIYSTDYKRTRDTVKPLAAELGLPLEFYDPRELKPLAKTLLESGQTSLVVGHSNTTPEMVTLLGGDPGPEIDEENEYDRLYIVTVDSSGAADSLLLRYGAH